MVALGPYSRFGWHHPGPVLFYLFAPLYALTGEGSRALFLDSWLLNAGCALATVVVLKRFAGDLAAVAGAGLLTVGLAANGFDRLIDPWNPSLLAVPVLLTLVASAAGACGSLGALFTAFLVGSYAVQTHIATVPVVVVSVLAGCVGCFLARRTSSTSTATKRTALRLGGIGVLVLIWAGPVIQEARHRDGNLTLLARFYLHPPAGAGESHHAWTQVVGAVTSYTATAPYGVPTDLHAHLGRVLVCVGLGLLGVATAVAARRRAPFAAWMAAATPLALITTMISAYKVIGPLMPYLFWWTALLGLPAVFGTVVLGATLLTQRRRAHAQAPARPQNTIAGLVGVGATTAMIVWSVSIMNSAVASYPDSPDARHVATAIEKVIGRPTQPPFLLRIVAAQFSDGPLLVVLAKAHYRYSVTPALDLYSGDAPSIPRERTFLLQPSANKPPTGAILVKTDGTLSAYLP